MINFKCLSSTLIAALTMTGLVACSPSNPQLGRPGVAPDTITDSAKASQLTDTPAVDILFVGDDSDSMSKHLQLVHDNMDSFVSSFQKNANVDFHVGLVKVFDSTRYGSWKVPNFIPNGQLQGGFVARSNYSAADMSNGKMVSDLSSLLNFKTKSIADGGPNKEEIFSPILAALTEPIVSSKPNAGFYRSNANLAVIILTDASDSSPNLDGDSLAEFMRELKGGDKSKVSAFAALALPNYGCPMDNDEIQPYDIMAFIENVKLGGPISGNIRNQAVDKTREMDLCSTDYGVKMAAIGKQIAEGALVDHSVKLTRIPDIATLQVSYNNLPIPSSAWSYQNAGGLNSVVINGTYPLPFVAGQKLQVTYKAVNNQNLQTPK